MKTIIAGSRNIINPLSHVAKAIGASGWLMQIEKVVSGGAKGIDQAGEKWAYDNQIPCIIFHANWSSWWSKTEPVAIRSGPNGKKYNALAGHNRNQRMADYADALVAVWDGESKGTGDMIARAEGAGYRK